MQTPEALYQDLVRPLQEYQRRQKRKSVVFLAIWIAVAAGVYAVGLRYAAAPALLMGWAWLGMGLWVWPLNELIQPPRQPGYEICEARLVHRWCEEGAHYSAEVTVLSSRGLSRRGWGDAHFTPGQRVIIQSTEIPGDGWIRQGQEQAGDAVTLALRPMGKYHASLVELITNGAPRPAGASPPSATSGACGGRSGESAGNPPSPA